VTKFSRIFSHSEHFVTQIFRVFLIKKREANYAFLFGGLPELTYWRGKSDTEIWRSFYWFSILIRIEILKYSWYETLTYSQGNSALNEEPLFQKDETFYWKMQLETNFLCNFSL